MFLRELITFKMINQYGSFQRAAEELNYAQSTITMQIQKLESELGVKLFERGKKIRLTEAGRLLNKKADTFLQAWEQMKCTMSEFSEGQTGSIRVGVMEPIASYRLPIIIKQFHNEFSKVDINIQIGNTPQLTKMLEKGDIDFAICSPPENSYDIKFEPLYNESLGLLIPKNHPLAIRKQLIPEDLKNQRFLLTLPECPYRKRLEQMLQEKNASPYQITEISSMSALKYYVQASLGIAVIPKIIIDSSVTNVVLKSIEDLDLYLPIGIVTKTSSVYKSIVVEKLCEFLKATHWK